MESSLAIARAVVVLGGWTSADIFIAAPEEAEMAAAPVRIRARTLTPWVHKTRF
jgi:hypothetical protein